MAEMANLMLKLKCYYFRFVGLKIQHNSLNFMYRGCEVIFGGRNPRTVLGSGLSA